MRGMNLEIVAGFVEESKSYTGALRLDAAAWNGDPSNGECLRQSRRQVHSMKGAASMIGMAALARVAFDLEESLEAAIRGEIHGPAAAAGLLRAAGPIDGYLDDAAAGLFQPAPHLNAALIAIRRLRSQPQSGDDAAVAALAALDADSSLPSSARKSSNDTVSSLLDTFRQEAEDHLQTIGRALRALEDNPADRDTLLELRRALHSLKGAGRAVGLDELADLAHRVEDVLDAVRDDRVVFSKEVASLIYRAFDAISDMTGDGAVEQELPELYAQLAGLPDSASAAASIAANSGGDTPEEDDVPAEFLDVFRQEADEHLQTIATRLQDLKVDPARKDAIQDIRRAVHTLKGAAGVIGLNSVNALAHRMEDFLDAAWEGSAVITPQILQLFFSTADAMTDLVAGPPGRGNARPRVAGLLATYRHVAGGGGLQPSQKLQPPPAGSQPEPEPCIDLSSIEAARTPPPKNVTAMPASRSSRYVRVPIERLDEIVRLVSELVVTRSTFEQYLENYRGEVGELNLSLERLRRLAGKFDSDFAMQSALGNFGQVNLRALNQKDGEDKRSEFDALEFDRYTDVHLVSRDLAETSSDINSAVSQLAHRSSDFDSCLNRLGRLTSDVQDRLMRVRMVPLANLATRLHRTVRVTSERLNKPVDLVLEGEQTEIDKTMLEELSGPLEHLLRNSIDHGLESAAARRSRGKSARGQIRVGAYYLGTQIVVEVSDDGAGMNADAIRKKAVELSMVTAAEAALMPDQDVFDFVFQPGFSTAREISTVSGRGVGLDVVRNAVHKLRGTVEIESRQGLGVTFRIKLPMSLAILRVLLVKSQGEQYAIPLASVSRILRLAPGQLEHVGKQQVLRAGGQVIPAMRLIDAFGGESSAGEIAGSRCPVLILNLGGQQLAVLVDELGEAREVVVKSMGNMLRNVRGIAGATIMGDGGIVLIVNPPELLSARRVRSIDSARARPAAARGLDVMVVDDSVSVRRVITTLLHNQGWNTTAAKDGMEALELLQSGHMPDAVLLDVEMPRMDGYELLAALRSQPQFSSLPIIMLTSRAGEKHRQKAFGLGVTDYLIKPYQEEHLIAVVRGAAEARAGALR